MGTKIRPSVSEKNENYISKERYYELAHFAKQYGEWQEELHKITLLPKGEFDPTGDTAVKEAYYLDRIAMLKKASEKVDLGEYILEAASRGWTFEELRASRGVPCCRNEYYRLYREWFRVLSGIRQ